MTLLAPWLPNLPGHWNVVQMRRVAAFRNGADYKHVEVEEGGHPVYGSGGEFRRASTFLYDGVSVLFGRKGTVDRPLLVSGKFWTVDTMFFTVLEPTIEPRFLHYYATTMPFGYYSTNTALPSMTQGDLAGHRMPLPPLGEQRAIADYLDRETARIDTLIREQQRLIEMLRERRRAVGKHAISSPWSSINSADKLGRSARIGNGSTPRRENPAYWDGGSIPWLNSSVVNKNRVGSAEQFVTAAAVAECHLPLVPPNSVLVGLTGQGKTRGMATILDIEATVNQHLAYVTPDPRKWWPAYLLWVLAAAYDDLRRISEENGSTKGGLTCAALKQFRVAIPPLEEQRRVAAHLEEQTAKIDALIAETERFVELSRERRSALITAAVTGQIDVRAVA